MTGLKEIPQQIFETMPEWLSRQEVEVAFVCTVWQDHHCRSDVSPPVGIWSSPSPGQVLGGPGSLVCHVVVRERSNRMKLESGHWCAVHGCAGWPVGEVPQNAGSHHNTCRTNSP